MSKLLFLGNASKPFSANKISAGFLLDFDMFSMIIDPGVGAVSKLYESNQDIKKIIGILVSNNDHNHCNDANALIGIISEFKEPLILCNDSYITGKNGLMLSKESINKSGKIIILRPFQSVKLNNLEVGGLPANHMDEEALSFIFSYANARIVYSSDTGYNPAMIDFYKGADIVILNLSNPKENRDDFRLNKNDVIQLLKGARPRLCILNHFSFTKGFDPLEVAREISKETNVETVAAMPGLIVNLEMFFKTVKQETLIDF